MKHGGVSVFAGVGERTREGNDLWLEFQESGVINMQDLEKSRAALVYGQMTEPPGARLRVALSGLTVAEYFRDAEKKDVLLFIDNIFRFTQAGSEVSALLGRMPSAVGYQPTLLTEMGELQERITSTKNGSITSVQAIYVPADDYTDPAPATTFAHLDATTNLSRAIVELGIYPGGRSAGVDVAHPRPAHHRRRALQRRPRGEAGAPALQGPAGHHRDPRHRRAVGRGQAHGLARAQDPEVPVAAVLRRRAVHRAARQVRADRRDGARASRKSSTASTTTSRSRRSTWSARSKKRWPKPRRWRRGNMALPTSHRTADRDPRQALVNEEVDEVEMPGTEGYFGVLPGHAPMLAALAVGEMWYRKGQEKTFLSLAGRVLRSAAGSGDDPRAVRRAGRGHRRRARRGSQAARRRAAGRRPRTSTTSARASRS